MKLIAALPLLVGCAAESVSWSATSYNDITASIGEVITFTYSSSHDVWQFPDEKSYDACDFSNATLLADSRDSPFDYTVANDTAFLGCSVGSHCSRSGQKIKVSAAKSTKSDTSVSWSATSYNNIVASVGDTITLTYSSSHDVYEFANEAAFDACDFSSATLLGGSRDSPFVYTVTSGDAYLGCSVGSHCSRSGQKIKISGAAKSAKADSSVSWSATSYNDVTASVGDVITFTYSSSHDVLEFPDKAAFDACDFSNAVLLGDTRDSPYEYVVNGTAYLGCSKGSHCSRSGQKIAILV